MKYRKKPIVIEAIQFLPETRHACTTFLLEGLAVFQFGDDAVWIQTLEGSMQANYGDWIIRGVKGEFYPCKPDIFEATYEAVDDMPSPFNHPPGIFGGERLRLDCACGAPDLLTSKAGHPIIHDRDVCIIASELLLTPTEVREAAAQIVIHLTPKGRLWLTFGDVLNDAVETIRAMPLTREKEGGGGTGHAKRG